MKKILFVDDEQNILNALKRMLRDMRSEWDMVFSNSAENGLEYLSKSKFDVIVSDVRMPGMDGVQFLNKVRDIYPNTVRIILSGHSDYNSSLLSTSVAHQFLGKPCDAAQIRAAIERSLSLVALLHNEKIQTIAAEKCSLPSAPDLFLEINLEIESVDSNLLKIGAIISKDIAMTAKIMQLVNSAFFGLPQKLTDVGEAVNYLGLDMIRSLIFYTEIFSSSDSTKSQVDLDKLDFHSMEVGQLSKRISVLEKQNRNFLNHTQLIGMLHDIGKIILGIAFPEKIAVISQHAKDNQQSIHQSEMDVLGCSHAEIGAYLLSLWGFPSAIIEAIAYHHQPSRYHPQKFDLVTAIHVAETLMDIKNNPQQTFENIADMEYLNKLNLTDHIDSWKTVLEEQE